MEFIGNICITKNKFNLVKDYLKNPIKGVLEDNPIIETYRFPNGYVMEIRCCGNKEGNSTWTEAVLLDSAGYKCAFTEPSVKYTGKWTLKYEGNIYIVYLHVDSIIEIDIENPQNLDKYVKFYKHHTPIGWMREEFEHTTMSRIILKMKPGHKGWTPYGCARDCGDHYIIARYSQFDRVDKKTLQITFDVEDK